MKSQLKANADVANRVHLTYFCTPSAPADAASGHPLFVALLASEFAHTHPHCAVATEYMEALLKLVLGLAWSAHVALSPWCGQ